MGTALPTTASSTSHDLGISVTDRGGAAIVCLSGRVSIDSSPVLRERLLTLLKRQSPPMLTIDLSDLAYIDCSGIATLIEALRIAHQRNSELQLRGLHDGPRHLLEVTGLLRLFDTDGPKDGSSGSKVS
ncbi:MAG TPA: STAS domain-containing protein [Terriglobia bacterium]|jgi:anti-sigma B factor antagonist|nr:STAS domain-containing protein [Terriglobia bacterium]